MNKQRVESAFKQMVSVARALCHASASSGRDDLAFHIQSIEESFAKALVEKMESAQPEIKSVFEAGKDLVEVYRRYSSDEQLEQAVTNLEHAIKRVNFKRAKAEG